MGDESKDELISIEEEQTYKIYDYMEKHHSLLIACISGMVAIGSLATSILVYIYQCMKLHTWNIPLELIGEIGKGKYFYVAVIGILYYFFVPIYQMHLQNVFKEHFCFFIYIKLQKKLIRKMRCYLKNKKKGCRKKYSIELVAAMKDLDNSISELKKSMRDVKRIVIFRIVWKILGSSILWVLFFVLFQVSMSKMSSSSIIVSIVCLFVLISVSLISVRNVYKGTATEELKNKINNINSIKEGLVLLPELYIDKQSFWKDIDKKREQKEFFSDNSLSIFGFFVIYAFVAVFIFFSVSGLSDDKMKNGFWIYQSQGGQYYAVVYQNQEQVILEEAIIENDDILINTNKQLFKIYEDNQFEYREFEHVKRIE